MTAADLLSETFLWLFTKAHCWADILHGGAESACQEVWPCNAEVLCAVPLWLWRCRPQRARAGRKSPNSHPLSHWHELHVPHGVNRNKPWSLYLPETIVCRWRNRNLHSWSFHGVSAHENEHSIEMAAFPMMDVYASQIREGLAKERSPKSALGKIVLAQCGWGMGRGRRESLCRPGALMRAELGQRQGADGWDGRQGSW